MLLHSFQLRKHWLQPDYFACLASHDVAHVFNSWNAMPPVSEQMAIEGSRTNLKLSAARFLLKSGRSYEQAVKTFQPYDRVQEVYPEAEVAGKKIIADGKLADAKKKTCIYMNNGLEGNAQEAIDAMIEEAE